MIRVSLFTLGASSVNVPVGLFETNFFFTTLDGLVPPKYLSILSLLTLTFTGLVPFTGLGDKSDAFFT